MKTIEEMQSAVDEIREVCRKHGVVLLGTCWTESIYGEITICENLKDSCGWSSPESVADNKVVREQSDHYSLGGIGDFVG